MKNNRIHVNKIQERHFSRKKKPLREAAQRIWGFYPEKKAPAGGRTTDMGFLYIKSKNPRSKIQKIQTNTNIHINIHKYTQIYT